MIETISIKNFKSVVDLTLNLGQFNIFIGENGCGKSNILEAIALAAAADANKLDYEFFANRGIRATEPQFMYSAFEITKMKYIEIEIKSQNNSNFIFKIHYNADKKPPQWEEKIENDTNTMLTQIGNIASDKGKFKIKDLTDLLESSNWRKSTILNLEIEDINGQIFLKRQSRGGLLTPYLIYSLEESKLRKYDNSNRIYPLGKNGEGLFAYLKEISQKKNGLKILNEIKENLCILDWFDDLEIPKNQLSNEFSLQVKDKYINETLHFFDQRSTNEGFLYLLFYLTLFISDETPSFFAIDNLEASFNPKLCREVTKCLKLLSKKHNKQVIATTHSPAILDGLDILNNDERLFVIRRNIDGYTKANRIEYKTSMNLPLSEVWTKGYIGGLPENF